MGQRREFIKTMAAGTAGLLAGCSTPSAGEAAPIAVTAPSEKLKGPIVLSTWDHGLAANARAWTVLEGGGTILDAAEQGVRVTESDLSNRSVGLGGLPDREGHTTLDACIQDHDGRCGAVAFLEGIEHPISVARAIMERTPHVFLVGEGARKWALENGFEEKQVDLPEVRAAYQEWLKTSNYQPVVNRENHDTIGLVALDGAGRMAGSCTTSGLAYKIRGRVGDSPIIGAGLFVDGDVGAACATGTGELMIRTVASHSVVEAMRHGLSPQEACEEVVRRILKFLPRPQDHQAGFIALRKDGTFGMAAIQPGFSVAVRDAAGERLVQATALWKG